MADSNGTTRTMTLPEMQALAGRLHARGASALGSDSSQSQSDMRLAAGVIRALLNRSIDASGAAGQLSIRLTSPIAVEGR